MSNLYPISWDLGSTREPEDQRLIADLTSLGTIRARKRHSRYRFDLVHGTLTMAESIALRAYCEQYEGKIVRLAWRDGTNYDGVLVEWSLDRRAGPRSSARVEIRGAEALT